MDLNDRNVEQACRTGVKLLTSETITMNSPNAWNADLGVLQNVLGAIVAGALKIVPTEQKQRGNKGDADVDFEGPPDSANDS